MILLRNILCFSIEQFCFKYVCSSSFDNFNSIFNVKKLPETLRLDIGSVVPLRKRIVVFTRLLPRDGDIAEDHGALQVGKLSMAWTRGRRETESRQKQAT